MRSSVHNKPGVNDGHIGNRADLQPGALIAQNCSRVAGEFFNSLRQAQYTLAHQGKRERQRGFKPDDAEGRMVELNIFFKRGVRRMVAGDHVNGSVCQGRL